MAEKSQRNNSEMSAPYKLAALVCILAALVAIVYIASSRTSFMIRTGGSGAQNSNLSFVSVSATGSATAIPSEAQLYLFINGTGNTSEVAVMNLSNEIAVFNSTIAPYLGGNSSLVKTSYYSVSRVYTSSYPIVTVPSTTTIPYNLTAPTYVAGEYITVTLPRLSMLNSALLNISKVPSLYVESASAQLSNSQIASLRPTALNSAISNATAQAQDAIGKATIVSKNITIESYSVYPYTYATGLASAPGSSASSNLVYNGTDSVSESVYVVFSYKG